MRYLVDIDSIEELIIGLHKYKEYFEQIIQEFKNLPDQYNWVSPSQVKYAEEYRRCRYRANLLGGRKYKN